ncbi:MAG: hypothetical protein P8N43_06310, partial [Alphaproteobacteria bacterium]|nr:hypothetical protein [Alphaproteobacteria bacterium]
FSAVEEFIGGTGADTFVLGAGVLTPIVSLDGSVGVNTLDITGVGGGQSVTLSGVGGGVGFAGDATGLLTAFDNITDLDTTGAGNTLTGADLDSVWTIDGVTGSVTAAGQSLAFAGFTSLAGGIANDSFTVTDDSAVDITTDTAIGGTGVDSVTISAGQTLTVTSDLVFGEGVDTLVLANDAVLTGGNANLGAGDDQVTLGTGAMIAGNVVGSTGSDNLSLGQFSSVTGTFDGGADVDTVDYSAISVNLTITLTGISGTPTDGFTGTDGGVTGGFLGVDVLVGGAATTDTLIGQDASNARWTVGATGLYQERSANLETVGFAGFERLQGGTTDDDFRLNSTAAGVTNISGGTGTDSLEGSTLGDLFNITSLDAGNMNLDTATLGATISFQSIEALDANDGDDRFVLGLNGRVSNVLDGGGDSDTISAPNLANTFVVNADNGGTLANATGTLGFADVENLEGNSGVDSFTVNAGFTLGGSVAAGAGADVVTLEAGAEVTGNVSLDGNDDTMTLNGGSSVGGTVTGGTGNETFTLTGAGTVSATIDGEAGTDRFDLAAGVMVNGALTGGADVDILTTDGSAATTFVIDQADSGTLSNR